MRGILNAYKWALIVTEVVWIGEVPLAKFNLTKFSTTTRLGSGSECL